MEGGEELRDKLPCSTTDKFNCCTHNIKYLRNPPGEDVDYEHSEQSQTPHVDGLGKQGHYSGARLEPVSNGNSAMNLSGRRTALACAVISNSIVEY